ncbi:MAG: metal-dependent transcriptional regulator [Planctomycetes bacterium]|nr:metal-dependent transcriptional regulator [Planctomycetota bacterium]
MSGFRRTRIEDYLIAVEQICVEGDSERATTGPIARLLGISNGTASSMLKQLAENSLLDHLPYEGVRLTNAGKQRARRVLRRQRLIELFLVRTLSIAWKSLADEAWELEPATSEQLIKMIDAFLDYPEFDPLGNPIPREDGTLPESDSIPPSTGD